VRLVTIPPVSRRSFSAQQLGLDVDVLTGLQFTSSAPVVLAATEAQVGDADAAAAGTEASMSLIFADAFVNPALAGTLYRETLGIYNPAPFPSQAAVSILLEGGLLDRIVVNLPAGGFGRLRVDQLASLQRFAQLAAMSLRIDALSPVVASLVHYDLFLGGGWCALATPLDLPSPLSLI
jgi:hypothetical protein